MIRRGSPPQGGRAQAALAGAANGRAWQLYVHVPFCERKCHYCDFTIALAGPEERHARFLGALEREMERHSARFATVLFQTVYLGGGTPSLSSGHGAWYGPGQSGDAV